MNVAEAVQTRRSIRSFSKESVALETIKRVLETARWTPSGCNFQPWEATVLTGEPLEALQQVLLQSKFDEPLEYDFSAPGQLEKYQGRLRRVGSAMYGAMELSGKMTRLEPILQSPTACLLVRRFCCCAIFPS